MATIEIPIPAIARETGSARMRVSLEGVEYVFRLQWNPREFRWTLDLYDLNDIAIVTGVALVPALDLIELVTDTRRPPGSLMVWQPAGYASDPTLDNLGIDALLLYYEAA